MRRLGGRTCQPPANATRWCRADTRAAERDSKLWGTEGSKADLPAGEVVQRARVAAHSAELWGSAEECGDAQSQLDCLSWGHLLAATGGHYLMPYHETVTGGGLAPQCLEVPGRRWAPGRVQEESGKHRAGAHECLEAGPAEWRSRGATGAIPQSAAAAMSSNDPPWPPKRAGMHAPLGLGAGGCDGDRPIASSPSGEWDSLTQVEEGIGPRIVAKGLRLMAALVLQLGLWVAGGDRPKWMLPAGRHESDGP